MKNSYNINKSSNNKENRKMKKFLYLTAVFTVMLSACSATYQKRSVYDDVYYSKKNAGTPSVSTIISEGANTGVVKSENNITTSEKVPVENAEYNNDAGYYSDSLYSEYNNDEGVNSNRKLNYSNSETYYDENGTSFVTNNYYYDDYYDYEYASRLKRFYDPYFGWSYYNEFYTNYYWYTYDPWLWGVSIYIGSPGWYSNSYYWDPYWGGYYNNWRWGSPHWAWGGYYGYGYYNSWYNHQYYHGRNYWNGYSNGYWNGYNDGYWDGYSDNYYNSYDHNSYFYGHRADAVSSGSNGKSNISFGDKFEMATVKNRNNAVLNGVSSSGVRNTVVSKKEISVVKGNDSEIKSTINAGGRNVNTIAVPKTVVTGNGVNTVKNGAEVEIKEKTAPKSVSTSVPKYALPKSTSGVGVNVQGNPKPKYVPASGNATNTQQNVAYPKKYSVGTTQQGTISKPVQQNSVPKQSYSKPKTYTSPTYSEPKSNQYYSKPKTYTVPSNNNMNMSKPDNNIKQKSYTTPKSSGGSSNYSKPSYSSPKSSDSYNYSAPKSSGNYSTPRNSGNSNSYNIQKSSSSSDHYSSPRSSGGSYSTPKSSGNSSSYSTPKSSSTPSTGSYGKRK